jgi:hypothetical protein
MFYYIKETIDAQCHLKKSLSTWQNKPRNSFWPVSTNEWLDFQKEQQGTTCNTVSTFYLKKEMNNPAPVCTTGKHSIWDVDLCTQNHKWHLQYLFSCLTCDPNHEPVCLLHHPHHQLYAHLGCYCSCSIYMYTMITKTKAYEHNDATDNKRQK